MLGREWSMVNTLFENGIRMKVLLLVGPDFIGYRKD